MWASENKLTLPDQASKLEEQITILSKINYYKRFQSFQGRLVNEEVLREMCTKLNLKNNSKYPKELHSLINHTWVEWKTYKEQEHVHRELQIEHMIWDANKVDDKKKASAIRKIKHV